MEKIIKFWPQSDEQVLALMTETGNCFYCIKSNTNDLMLVEPMEPYVKNKKIAPNKKKVYQFKFDGTFVAEWESLLEAAKSIGVNSTSALTMCIQGKRKSAYGYVWKDNVE